MALALSKAWYEKPTGMDWGVGGEGGREGPGGDPGLPADHAPPRVGPEVAPPGGPPPSLRGDVDGPRSLGSWQRP